MSSWQRLARNYASQEKVAMALSAQILPHAGQLAPRRNFFLVEPRLPRFLTAPKGIPGVGPALAYAA